LTSFFPNARRPTSINRNRLTVLSQSPGPGVGLADSSPTACALPTATHTKISGPDGSCRRRGTQAVAMVIHELVTCPRSTRPVEPGWGGVGERGGDPSPVADATAILTIAWRECVCRPTLLSPPALRPIRYGQAASAISFPMAWRYGDLYPPDGAAAKCNFPAIECEMLATAQKNGASDIHLVVPVSRGGIPPHLRLTATRRMLQCKLSPVRLLDSGS